MKISRLLTSLTAVMALTAASAAHSADIVVVNFDPPGVGFNDPTPVEPVGGNPGTTLGEQRLNVFAVAAQSWGAELESDVPIFLGALFSPLACSSTSGVLGAAGPTSVFANFPGAKIDEIWYVGALADSLAGTDLDPGFIDLMGQSASPLLEHPHRVLQRRYRRQPGLPDRPELVQRLRS